MQPVTQVVETPSPPSPIQCCIVLWATLSSGRGRETHLYWQCFNKVTLIICSFVMDNGQRQTLFKRSALLIFTLKIIFIPQRTCWCLSCMTWSTPITLSTCTLVGHMGLTHTGVVKSFWPGFIMKGSYNNY